MAQNITRRQHYVWRNYLKAWTKNDKIFSYNKYQKKVFPSSLMKVAQQNYFNRFYTISGNEKKFLEYSCHDLKGPIKEYLNDIVTLADIFTGIKNINLQLGFQNKELDALEKNGYESLHTEMESCGNKLIMCRKFEDIKFFDDDLSKFEALTFLCYQYFRTKNLRDRQIETFKNDNLDINKIFSPLAIINATKVSQNICFDSSIRYIFLEKSPDSDLSFITGDQPVINLVGNITDDEGFTTDLIFYYPISPNHAIKISFDNSGEKYQHQILNRDEIHFFNYKIRDEYNEFIFSDSQLILENYI